jgi:single-stranded DNA-binding protein
MSLASLAIGKIFGNPESRTSKNGNAFTKATLCIVTGNERQFVTLFAFSQTVRDELARLEEGDNISVQGPLKAEIYERDGQARVSLSMTADLILALRQPPKERKKREPAPAPAHSEKPAPDRDRLDRHNDGGVDHFNDSIPF